MRETPAPQGEQPGISPLQAARNAVNNELLGKRYKPGVLVMRTVQLHNELVASDLGPDKAYHEAILVADQGAQRAEAFGDTETAVTLRGMKQTYELTYETLRSKTEPRVATSEPTQTLALPPMVTPKGVGVESGQRLVIPTRPPRTPKKTPEVTPADEQGEKEETLGSFIRHNRAIALLSQKKLADGLDNLHQPQISAIERDLGDLNREQATQMISTLKLDEADTEKFWNLYNKKFGEPPQSE